MRIYDLIQKVSYDDVICKVKLFYGSECLEEIECLLIQLMRMEPQETSKVLTIFINAYVETDDEIESVDEFDENDKNVIYDIIAYSDTDEEPYSIEAVEKELFLNFRISDETLSRFSDSSILAHCLWDVSAFSLVKKP